MADARIELSRTQGKFRCITCGSSVRVRASSEDASITHCLRCLSWLDTGAIDPADLRGIRESLALVEDVVKGYPRMVSWRDLVADLSYEIERAGRGYSEVAAAAAIALYGTAVVEDTVPRKPVGVRCDRCGRGPNEVPVTVMDGAMACSSCMSDL